MLGLLPQIILVRSVSENLDLVRASIFIRELVLVGWAHFVVVMGNRNRVGSLRDVAYDYPGRHRKLLLDSVRAVCEMNGLGKTHD